MPVGDHEVSVRFEPIQVAQNLVITNVLSWEARQPVTFGEYQHRAVGDGSVRPSRRATPNADHETRGGRRRTSLGTLGHGRRRKPLGGRADWIHAHSTFTMITDSEPDVALPPRSPRHSLTFADENIPERTDPFPRQLSTGERQEPTHHRRTARSRLPRPCSTTSTRCTDRRSTSQASTPRRSRTRHPSNAVPSS